MLEPLCRYIPGVLLCAVAGWLCWAYCADRTLKRDREDLASFFYPADLVSAGSLEVLRFTFAALSMGLLLAGYVATTGDDATLRGLNSYLLNSLVLVAPSGIDKAVTPIRDHVLQDDFGWATGIVHSLTLTILAGLTAIVFTPHLIAFYRLVRSRFQRLIDNHALLQARPAVRRFADRNPGTALQRLMDAHPNLAIPPELDGADPELKLTYAVLALAARMAPTTGITGAIALAVEEAPQDGAQRTVFDGLQRMGAAAFLYLAGCVLYVAVVPMWSTTGSDGSTTITLRTHWFCYICDWIAYQPDSLRDLGLQIVQFSAVVVLPFLIGLYYYTGRRHRLPAEKREEAIREVLSDLFILPLSASIFFIGVEALRFHFQPEQTVPNDLAASLVRNVVRDILMSCIPLLLVWVWTSLRETRASLLLASVAGALVSASCCAIIQLIFQAMLTAQDSIHLTFEAHAALLGFYLVCLSGMSVLLFLPDVLRAAPE